MEIGIVRPVLIEEEMKGAYLDYAMSVITARALPDVRDGLKPVQRRILYSMDELALRHTSAYKKSARIVGEVMGKYHPHGDAPVYEAMVRMAQDFSMRYPLVDGQGNFGSVDGDPPAAMRYTEARLAALAEEMLADIDKNTVDFVANFDDTLKEPKVLPSKLPNLLVNGSAGIAVGMATNIPPHNLGEVVDALTHIVGRFGQALDGGVPFSLVWGRAFGSATDLSLAAQALKGLVPAFRSQVEERAAKLARRPDGDQRAQAMLEVLDDIVDIPPAKLIEFVKGPDFPTAGIILGEDGIKNAYATGHGRISIRARAHTEDMRGGRTQIVVTELPFQVNKATLLEKIAELVRERRVEGISELRDESDRQGMRIVIELRREAQARQILNQLYKYTSMQTAFSVNLLALVDGQPRVLTLKMSLLHYLNHRREVITRRTEFDLQKARHRAHILEGLKIALEHLDEVIATIRRAKDAEAARLALMKNFKLSEPQAQAILDMQLRRLAALERQKILDEYKETLKLIAHLEDLLAHPVKILYLIRDELAELKTKYGDGRRTQIRSEEAADFTEEDLVPDQEVAVSLSHKGYLRRVLAESYRGQRRGSKGIAGTVSKEDDPPGLVVVASARDSLLFFTNRGRAYQMRVNDVPDVTRQARGLPIGSFISLDEQERVVAALPASKVEGNYVVLATRRGEVKRVAGSEYAGARGAGIIGAAVPEADDLVGAVTTNGRQEVFLVTAGGQAIRFGEGELRPSGRNSGGVRGIRLTEKDRVLGVAVARAGAELVVVSRKGLGKRMPLVEFSAQGRGGGGLRAANVSIKSDELVGATIAGEADELLLITASGTLVRTVVSSVPAKGRSAQGNPIIELARDDRVLGTIVVPARDRGPTDGNGEEPGGSGGPEGDRPAGEKSGGQNSTAKSAPKAAAAGQSSRPSKAEARKDLRPSAEAASPVGKRAAKAGDAPRRKREAKGDEMAQRGQTAKGVAKPAAGKVGRAAAPRLVAKAVPAANTSGKVEPAKAKAEKPQQPPPAAVSMAKVAGVPPTGKGTVRQSAAATPKANPSGGMPQGASSSATVMATGPGFPPPKSRSAALAEVALVAAKERVKPGDKAAKEASLFGSIAATLGSGLKAARSPKPARSPKRADDKTGAETKGEGKGLTQEPKPSRQKQPKLPL